MNQALPLIYKQKLIIQILVLGSVEGYSFIHINIQTMMNNITHSEFSTLDVVLTTPEKIVLVFLWIVIEVVGNGLLLGLIQFDRFGGDPCKRRIVDQVIHQVLLQLSS